MGTSTQCPVFYPLEEGRRSKGKNSLRDWVRNKDYVACKNAPRFVFLTLLLLGYGPTGFWGGNGCCTIPPYLQRTQIWWQTQGRVFVWKNHMCLALMDKWRVPSLSVVLLPVIRCFCTIHWPLQSTCSLNWQWQRWRARCTKGVRYTTAKQTVAVLRAKTFCLFICNLQSMCTTTLFESHEHKFDDM